MRVGEHVGSAVFQAELEGDQELTAEELALYQTIAPGLPDDVQNRLQEYVKEPFLNNREMGFWILIRLLRDEIEALESVALDVLESQYVRHAVGDALDDIGDFVHTPRRTGENDTHYRIRLKVQLRKYIGGATFREIRQIAAILVETDISQIEIREPFEAEAARIDVFVDGTALDNSRISVDDLVEFLSEVRAGGVELRVAISGSFGYRSLDDYYNDVNDPERAYNIGPYSGSISE